MFSDRIPAADTPSVSWFFYNGTYLLLFCPVICRYPPFCVQYSYFYLCCKDFFCVLHENANPTHFSLCTVHNFRTLHPNKAPNFCSFLRFLSHKTLAFLPVNWYFSACTAIFSLPNCIFACIILTLSF